MFKNKKVKIAIISLVCLFSMIFVFQQVSKNIKYKEYMLSYESYLNDSNYKEAKLALINANKIKTVSDYKNKYDQCDKMQSSIEYYNLGLSLMSNKYYNDAYIKFKYVSKDDTERYSSAQEKMKEVQKLAYEKVIQESKDLDSEGRYFEAYSATNEYLEYFGNNDEIKKLSTEYTKKQEEKDRLKVQQDIANLKSDNQNQTSQSSSNPIYHASFELLEHKSVQGSIYGKIKNITKSNYGYVEVDINLLDESGNLVDSTFTNVNNLGAGQTWSFEAVVFKQSRVKSYQIIDVNGR